MSAPTIDHSTLSRMVEAGAVQSARVIGQAGGWSVAFHTGTGNDYMLSIARKGQTRLFRKIDTLIAYLKDLGISQFAVDADAYIAGSYTRPDRSEALKQAHEAAEHDRWVREELDERIRIADAPDAVWIPHEEVMAERARWREEVLAKLAGTKS